MSRAKLILFLSWGLVASVSAADVVIGIVKKVPHDFFAQAVKGFQMARKQAQDPEMGKYGFYIPFSSEGKSLGIVMSCKPGAPLSDGSGCAIHFLPATPTPIGAIETSIVLTLREVAVVRADQELTKLLSENSAQTSKDHLHVLRPFNDSPDLKDNGTHLYCAPEDSGIPEKKMWQCYASVSQRL